MMFRTLCQAPVVVLCLLALAGCRGGMSARVAPPPAPVLPAAASSTDASAPVPLVDDAEAARLAGAVREQVRHAWQGYMRHARGA